MATILEKAKQILDEKNNKLLAENIKKGVQIFDVVGTLESGVDTSDATAIADNIEQGKTAYVNGQKIEGSLPVFGVPTDMASNVQYQENAMGNYLISSAIKQQTGIIKQGTSISMQSEASKVAEAIGLTANKLAKGNTILGISGTYEGEENAVIETTFTTYNNLVSNIVKIPPIDTSNLTSAYAMFQNCRKLIAVPQIDTSNVTNMNYMFQNCLSLETIPLLDTSKVTSMQMMFSGCTKLTNESLNNILLMCANASAYTGTKTLKYFGLSEEQATRCQSLSNYSAFTAAGWTTGY